MVLAESELSHRAAEESLPLRDAFAVLFFVSVGMLFDPTILVREPGPLIAALLIVMLGKSVAALLIVLAFRHPLRTALTISASLAQIGEFSFILAGLGVSLGLLPQEGRDLILAVAILSILLNPLFFAALDRLAPWLEQHGVMATTEKPAESARTDLPTSHLKHHMVLVGFGRVGSRVGDELEREFHLRQIDVFRLHPVFLEHLGEEAETDAAPGQDQPPGRTLLEGPDQRVGRHHQQVGCARKMLRNENRPCLWLPLVSGVERRRERQLPA